MQKVKTIVCVVLLIFLAACAQTQLAGLNLGVNVSKQYLDLRERYEQIYETSSSEMQEYMQTKIAPKFNEAREQILVYNDLILRGTDPGQQREVIIEILVEVSRMMEVL